MITQLAEERVIILAISVALASLGLATFFSLRTTLLYNSRVADVNVYSYTIQAGITSGNEAVTCLRIAKEWLNLSKDYRKHMELRALSANLCFYSLISLGAGFLIIFIWEEPLWLWLVPFGVSVILLLLAFAISKLDKACKVLYLAGWPVHVALPRLVDIEGIREKHPSLETSTDSR